jgi:TonB-linked SusC/RagA family outer membrane protein
MRRFFVQVVPLLAVAALANMAQAQATREVTGKVTEAGTSAPLVDATVGIQGQAVGVRTNDKGEFRLRVPQADVTLQARAIGYKRITSRVPFSQGSTDFVLEKDVLQLEGVTITGAATSVEKRNAATAVASVTSEDLNRVPAPSLESALQGKVIGSSINMNNGAPGGGGQVQIRGASSLIGNIQPLFVVDGIIINNTTRSNRLSVVTGSLNAGEENGTNRLADINPNDIESIEVLKAAAASAIYGSQATNGVVIINTKRGKAGAPRFNITQRVGTYQLIRNQGTRHFSNLDQVLGVIGDNADGVAAAQKACTASSCPYYDYVGQLYGQTDPTYETVANLTGGVNNTRYFVSGLNREEKGTAANTGARRQSLRANLDQAIGSKITASVNANMLRSFSQRGIANNDNALSSPLYAFAYTPAIVDLKTRDAQGNFPLNAAGLGGILGGSNPFQTFALMTNNEDVNRGIFSGRVNYSAYTDAHNTLTLSVMGGADRFSSENYILAPQVLQFQRAGTVQGGSFPGTAIQGNGDNLSEDATATAVWQFNPGKWASFETSGGYQAADRSTVDFNIIGRGLGPQQTNASGAANTTVTNTRTLIKNQAFYAQEAIIAMNEKLYLSGSIRGERSSVNGDFKKYFYFPRGSASYRIVSPFKGISEIKLRGSIGESGNQANYGDRFILSASQGQIGGRTGYGVPGVVGNPVITPERLRETEYGIDATFLDQRVSFEGTYYDRDITDLLVRPLLATSTGFSQATVNGGKMRTKGYELGATIVPIQMRNFSWTSRTTWFQNSSAISSFPVGVNPFTIGAAGGFGNAYGQLRFTSGYPVSEIFGNKVINGVTTANTPMGDANPKYTMSFSNDFTWKALSLNVLADYRRGGMVSNMTENIFDEGGNTWDYDKPSPDKSVGAELGSYRYNLWKAGANAGAYIVDGSYFKLREVNVTWDIPKRFTSSWRGVQSARLSLAGRNLFIVSPYNGYDPEVNNGGNQVSRFVDLAPFPPNRSFFFTIDLGF